MSIRKPVTAAQMIPPGSAQKRPGPREEFAARIVNTTQLSPKAAAQQARDQADRARVEKAKANAPATRTELMAARMYPNESKPAHVAEAKKHGAILAKDEQRPKVEPGWNHSPPRKYSEG